MSSWRPGQLSAAEQVEVNVRNCLHGIFATIEHRSITTVEPFLLSDLFCCEKQVANQDFIFRLEVVERWDGLSRNDQNVNGCLRIDVPEREAGVVFVNDIGRNLVIRDFFKESFFGHFESYRSGAC